MTNIDWKYPKKDGWPPDEEKDYLVTLRGHSVRRLWWKLRPRAGSLKFCCGTKRYSASSIYVNEVVAWAELPEPAKEQE